MAIRQPTACVSHVMRSKEQVSVRELLEPTLTPVMEAGGLGE